MIKFKYLMLIITSEKVRTPDMMTGCQGNIKGEKTIKYILQIIVKVELKGYLQIFSIFKALQIVSLSAFTGGGLAIAVCLCWFSKVLNNS